MLRLFIVIFSIIFQPFSIEAFNENMAWRSSGSSNKELIENLYRNGLITNQRIKEAMLKTDRSDFTDRQSDAYDDRPQPSIFKYE